VTTIDGTPQIVTVTIHGSNDAAIISGAKTGSVTEAAGYKPGKPVATGTLTDTDIDNAPNAFTAVHTPKASTGGYGTFTMTADGCWTYILDNANHRVQALNNYDTLTDTFTVTTIDGTPQVVTISIHGTNDAAIIYGATTGSVTEAGHGTYGTPKATGTLTDSDVDNAPNTFTAVDCPTASEGGYGSFTMTAAGVWTYTLDNSNCVVQALNDCDTLTDCFKVTTIDGTAQVITITIHGTDDAKYPPHIYATHADALIAADSGNGAGIAAGSAPAQTTDTGFGLDAGRDNGPSASFDEARPSSNNSSDEAAATDTSAPPADPHSDHVTVTTEQNFVFAQTPSPGSAGNNSGIAAPSAADDKTAPNPGEHEPSHVANAHDAEPASTAGSGVAPGNAGAHEHGQSFNFKDAISHLGGASGVELADAGHGPASTNHRGHAMGTDAHQAIADATQTIGHDHFNAVPDHIANAVFAPVHHDIMV
jgi:VCBS repeat-containing protein